MTVPYQKEALRFISLVKPIFEDISVSRGSAVQVSLGTNFRFNFKHHVSSPTLKVTAENKALKTIPKTINVIRDEIAEIQSVGFMEGNHVMFTIVGDISKSYALLQGTISSVVDYFKVTVPVVVAKEGDIFYFGVRRSDLKEAVRGSLLQKFRKHSNVGILFVGRNRKVEYLIPERDYNGSRILRTFTEEIEPVLDVEFEGDDNSQFVKFASVGIDAYHGKVFNLGGNYLDISFIDDTKRAVEFVRRMGGNLVAILGKENFAFKGVLK